jgi:ABC-2 type transport system permease protein
MSGFNNLWAIVQKEWRHYFSSPIGYTALCMWTFIFGLFYNVYFGAFAGQSVAPRGEFGPKLSVAEWIIRPLLGNMAVVALFLTPMLTMRLFAEEKRQGTIELLATSPLTEMQIILGKFVAALGFYGLMILTGLLNFILLWGHASSPPELLPTLLGVLAVFLVGASFMSLGLFLSTLTRNQIIAGVLTFGLGLTFWVLSWFESPVNPAWLQVLTYIGVTAHMDDMMRGVLDLKDLVFYLSFILFGLFLTYQSVASQRWRA